MDEIPTHARYSSLDHGGLEAVQPPDDPEVYKADPPEAVVNDQGPEVVPGSNVPLDRRDSRNQPEAWHVDQTSTGFPYEKEKPIAEEQEGDAAATPPPSKWWQRRYCGMRGLVLAILLAVSLVVMVAVLLGAILGVLLPREHTSSSEETSPSDSSNSTQPAPSGSGRAVVQSGLAAMLLANSTDTVLIYYQDESNRIMESVYVYALGAWASQTDTSSNASMVTNLAQGRSPLSAISYQRDGITYRQLFYIADDQSIQTTLASNINSTWSAPSPIVAGNNGVTTTAAIAPNSAALAACWGNGNLTGIRLYYGTTNSYVQEFGYSFNTSEWSEWYQFNQSDALTGVGCDFYNSEDNEFMNVYMRNTTTGVLQQNFWSFTYNDGWSLGPTGLANMTIGSGTGIAVTSDEVASEYVFYQNGNGTVTRALCDPSGSSFEAFDVMEPAISGGKLAAAYFDGGSVYVFQNSTIDPTIWLHDVSRTGVSVASLAIPRTGGNETSTTG